MQIYPKVEATEFVNRRAFVDLMKKMLRLVWDQIIPLYDCSAAPVHHNVPADSHQVNGVTAMVHDRVL